MTDEKDVVDVGIEINGKVYTAGGFSFLDDGKSDFLCERGDVSLTLERASYTIDEACAFLMSLK